MARQKSVPKEQTQPLARPERKGVASARGRRELAGRTIAANQARFDELIALNIKAAYAARLYAQITCGRYLSQAEICLASSIHLQSSVSRSIRAVLSYLDPNTKGGRDSKRLAEQIARDVDKSHRLTVELTVEKAEQERLQKEIENRKRAARLLGVRKIPDNLPPELFDEFVAVRRAYRDGRLHKLRQEHPKFYEAIRQRYGNRKGVFHTYREINSRRPGTPHYYVGQGLVALGIKASHSQ